ncbi:MAG: DSBA-like thioredoxin domain-containing protein [Microgenomates group bacterium Gr01-1014_80]|nr:MAG: DSBA-like thioredoxin domain-containing protein [Microgenomates group bacterium Gr01-1014_80]
MKSGINPLTSTPAAILLGALIIGFAILFANGVIVFSKDSKGQTKISFNQPGLGAAQAPSAPGGVAAGQPQAAPQAKSEAEIVNKLKEYVKKVGADENKFSSCLDSGEKAALVKADLAEGSTAGVNGTPAFFINGRMISGAVPFEQFKVIIDEELNGTAASTVERKTIAVGNLPAQGPESAKVTLIEFSDYECPFCERHFTQTESKIKTEYIDKGLIKFYYRDFPLSQIHPGAQKAAEAARCAGDQNKYWEYHDAVFENQQDIF